MIIVQNTWKPARAGDVSKLISKRVLSRFLFHSPWPGKQKNKTSEWFTVKILFELLCGVQSADGANL